jgi:hypothetical protein
MRNRAKCKLCKSIIESYHDTDYVDCKCGEISVSGGSALYCAAKSWDNFVRVDDRDSEIITKVVDDVKPLYNDDSKPNKKQLIEMLERDIANMEGLPQSAMVSPVTHYDLVSSLMIVLAIFKSET